MDALLGGTCTVHTRYVMVTWTGSYIIYIYIYIYIYTIHAYRTQNRKYRLDSKRQITHAQTPQKRHHGD